MTIINKKRKAFVCTLWDLAAPGEKRYPNFPGIYKAKCIPSGASQGLGGRVGNGSFETQGICRLLCQAKLTWDEWSSHGVELKIHLLSKCIPACHKLSKTGCKWTKHGDEGTLEIQEGSCMGLGLSLAGRRTDQSQKNEINALNTFIGLLTITKHNVWPSENKKQRMDWFWSRANPSTVMWQRGK